MGVVAGTCPQSRTEGFTTKSWFDYLKSNGQAKEDYLLGKYLWEDRYYVAPPEEVKEWRHTMVEQTDLLTRLSSQQRPREDSPSDLKTTCLWGEQFPEFIGQTVRMLNRQLYQVALRQAVLERISAKYFDDLQIPAPHLQHRLEQVQESFKSIAEGLTEALKFPFLGVEESLLPKPVQAEDVRALLDMFEHQALLWMRWWAGEHAAAAFLLEAWTREGLREISESPP